MNLAKLFNFKFLIQNIKKSKMAIALFLSIVPIFTVLTIIMTSSSTNVLSFESLGLPNIIFMYITPFILSFSLFSYVYKKTSIDFVGSMPISRKSIFATNTIGGILLIILTQLITLLCTMLLSAITDSYVFWGLAFDIFIFQSIAYIFVFTVSNLAMSLSGNVMTQIIVTLLITFIIPASSVYVRVWNNDDNNVLRDGDYYFTDSEAMNYNSYSSLNDIKAYTAPSLAFNDGNYAYNTISLIKMIALSLLYIGIGYIAFNKKKLEIAGESFENKYVHLFVKGLTTIPFAMILMALADNSAWKEILFLIAIVAVYYLIYDLVTNKKNKIIVNLLTMVISLVVLFSVYTVLIRIDKNITDEIELSDIKSITIKQIGYNGFRNLNYKITDGEKIKEIMYSTQNNSYSQSSNKVEIILTTKIGKQKKWSSSVPNDKIQEILKDVTIKDIGSDFIFLMQNDVNLTREENKNIENMLKNLLMSASLGELYKVNTVDINTTKISVLNLIYVYDYYNHELRKIGYPMSANEEMFNILTKAFNRKTYEYLRIENPQNVYMSIKNEDVLGKYLPDYSYYYYYGECPEEIIEYIVNNPQKQCDLNKEYVILNVSGKAVKSTCRFYTNDVETIANIMVKYYDKQEYEYDKKMIDDFGYDETIEVVPNESI